MITSISWITKRWQTTWRIAGRSFREVALRLPLTLLRKFNIITISTTLKSLPDLEPIAKALPLMLAKNGRWVRRRSSRLCSANPHFRVVVVDLHPAFSKPAGHRGMEIYEDPLTGKQKLSTYIKVPQYLDVKPCKSEAVRGQPEPLVCLESVATSTSLTSRSGSFTGPSGH